MTIKVLTDIYQTIVKAKKIFLITHYKPDGDAIGSLCLMAEWLNSINKPYLAYCFDQPPASFSYLPNFEKITNQKNFVLADFDVIISLDCGSLSRTKLEKEILSRSATTTYIEIDHHPKTDDVADLEFRVPELASTTEALYLFIKQNQITITRSLANCLLTGLLTDTGNFVFTSTSKNTLAIASEMLALGANYPKII